MKKDWETNWKNWNEFLFGIFVTSRMWPGWADIYESADAEDRAYFMFLEDELTAGRMQVWPAPTPEELQKVRDQIAESRKKEHEYAA